MSLRYLLAAALLWIGCGARTGAALPDESRMGSGGASASDAGGRTGGLPSVAGGLGGVPSVAGGLGGLPSVTGGSGANDSGLSELVRLCHEFCTTYLKSCSGYVSDKDVMNCDDGCITNLTSSPARCRSALRQSVDCIEHALSGRVLTCSEKSIVVAQQCGDVLSAVECDPTER
jgi:hypothetical protein